MLKEEIFGTIKWFDPKLCYGYIGTEEFGDVWVHKENLAVERIYQGDRVRFSVMETEKGRQAWNVKLDTRRPVELQGHPGVSQDPILEGEIIEWGVDPAGGASKGLIWFEEGDEPAEFEYSDIIGEPGRRIRPRPWHTATFRLDKRALSPRAREVRVDYRYPLHRFAYFPDEDGAIAELADAIALREDWDYRNSRASRPNQILHNYLHFSFAKLKDEDRGQPPEERKIRIRNNMGAALFEQATLG